MSSEYHCLFLFYNYPFSLNVTAKASAPSLRWFHLHPAGGAKSITRVCSLFEWAEEPQWENLHLNEALRYYVKHQHVGSH